MTTTVCWWVGACVRTRACVCEPPHIKGTEDRLTAIEPCCGLILSKVTEGHTRGHMCVRLKERDCLGAYACKQPNTCMYSSHTHTHTHIHTHTHT